MNFGEVLQTKRKSMGLTQEDLADKLFVSSKTISNWETNKTTPDIDNVRFKDNIIKYIKVSYRMIKIESKKRRI